MEVEAKYIVSEDILPVLTDMSTLGRYDLGEAEVVSVTDRYLDTADHRILCGGYACRLRQRGAVMIATLKSLTPAETEVHTREEMEVTLDGVEDRPTDWPAGDARELAVRLTDGAPLSTLFVIRQQRTVRPILMGQDIVAEWSLDDVTVDSGGHTEHYHELELELKAGGSSADLAEMTAFLGLVDGLTPQLVSKFERAAEMLGLTAAAANAEAPVEAPARETGTARETKGPGVDGDDTMAEAGRKIFRYHFKRMRKQEPGVRAGEDIEAVHQMRVATRRMRAAMAMFAPYYRPKVVKEISRGLKATARALGAVRDLDVFLERAESYRAKLPPPMAAGLDPMFGHWHKMRDKARLNMMKWLDDAAYEAFEERFKTFVETPGANVATDSETAVHPTQVKQIAPALIWEAYARVRAYEPLIPDSDIATLHALRIEGKRLRYTLEFFAEDLGPGANRLITAVTAMQDHLGNLHDADVDVAALTAYLAERDGRDGNLQTVRAYLSRRMADRSRLRGSFDKVWRRIVAPGFRRELGAAVAFL